MKLLITGASGFLGKYIVAAALRRGHPVRAVVRSSVDTTRLPWYDHPSVDFVALDLHQPDGIVEALHGVDAVIHLAAAKTGNYEAQYASTVVATQNLIDAMIEANVLRLIAIGTFSVFDYLQLQSGTTVNEETPIDRSPAQRDVYAQTKLIQESVFRDFEQNQGGQVTILRPGMIYGRDALWNACLGVNVKDKLWIRIGTDAQLPLTYVENCADAIVLAAECDGAIAKTINLVDDDLPTQNTYASELAKRMTTPPSILIRWSVMRLLTDLIWSCNQLLLRGRAKLPGLFIPARLHARFKPLRYSNDRAKQLLNWHPKYDLSSALDRSCSTVELLSVPQEIPNPKSKI
ncbi:MAG: NAD(P)-dependent oxidoreductase [Leptolyngbyaceae cyanobacterium RU_5_1]|nr:NAD(P)-dependent oxidoreductase [Leptolyngbyaceae cyanobacterium RU_5_1]